MNSLTSSAQPFSPRILAEVSNLIGTNCSEVLRHLKTATAPSNGMSAAELISTLFGRVPRELVSTKSPKELAKICERCCMGLQTIFDNPGAIHIDPQSDEEYDSFLIALDDGPFTAKAVCLRKQFIGFLVEKNLINDSLRHEPRQRFTLFRILGQ